MKFYTPNLYLDGILVVFKYFFVSNQKKKKFKGKENITNKISRKTQNVPKKKKKIAFFDRIFSSGWIDDTGH